MKMYMTEQQFIAGFKRMAEVCGRPLTDGVIAFYLEKVKTAEAGKLAAAMSLFATRGKWPTPEDLMLEVGIVPPMSRKEREEFERTQKNAPPPPADKWEDVKNCYGVWAFHAIDLQGQRVKANQVRQKLLEHGWKIDKEEVLENLERQSIVNVREIEKIQKTVFIAQRSKGGDSIPVMKDEKLEELRKRFPDEQEYKKAIMRLMHERLTAWRK
jgi:hypothetical protein